MFKPVKGAALDQFDEETQEMYKKRDNDPRLSFALTCIPRRGRHNLPVIVDTDNQYMKEKEASARNFKWKFLGGYAFFSKYIYFYVEVLIILLYCSFRLIPIHQSILSIWYHPQKSSTNHSIEIG